MNKLTVLTFILLDVTGVLGKFNDGDYVKIIARNDKGYYTDKYSGCHGFVTKTKNYTTRMDQVLVEIVKVPHKLDKREKPKIHDVHWFDAMKLEKAIQKPLREQTPRQKSKHKGTFMPAMSKNKRDDYKARHNIGEVGQSGKPRSALGRLQAGEQPTGSCMPVSPTPSLNLSESDISLATDRSRNSPDADSYNVPDGKVWIAGDGSQQIIPTEATYSNSGMTVTTTFAGLGDTKYIGTFNAWKTKITWSDGDVWTQSTTSDGPWTCPECDHANAFGDMCCDECNFRFFF